MTTHSPTDDRYRTTAQFYDQHSEYRDRPDVPFFVEEAVVAGGPVLEIGCGTGRVLIPTARAGVPIVGLDGSNAMLAVCRDKLAREPAEVRERTRLVAGDMRDFALGETFRLVTLPFRPFQHLLTVDDQLRCLACISAHLEVGSRLILDVFNPSLPRIASDSLGEEFPEGEPFTTPDGHTVQRSARIVSRDRFAQIFTFDFIYEMTHADGRRERTVETMSLRWLFRFEAEHLLARAGFEVLHLYSDYERSPIGAHDPGELVFIAQKNGT